MQVVERDTADGQSKSMRFRVRIKRKQLKQDRYFDELADAIEFLQESKKLDYVKRHEAHMQEVRERIAFYGVDKPQFRLFIKKFKTEVVGLMPIDTELQRRNQANRLSFLSFLRTIGQTVVTFPNKTHDLGAYGNVKESATAKFEDLYLDEISGYKITNYVEERLSQKKLKHLITGERREMESKGKPKPKPI